MSKESSMKLPTLFVLVGMFIISLYFLIEVDYYASAVNVNISSNDTPWIKIPKIGVDQDINNRSIDYGIYFEPKSSLPGKGTTILFGHRTLHGSPFLKLDQLQPGDEIDVIWPGIGTAHYSVSNHTIVDASYQMPLDQGNNLVLVTCYPLGSDTQRLVIEAKYVKVTSIQQTQSVPNTQSSYAFLFIAGLLGAGLLLTGIYPVKEDKLLIFIATIALTLLLVYAYFFPVPTTGIESVLSKLNELLSF